MKLIGKLLLVSLLFVATKAYAITAVPVDLGVADTTEATVSVGTVTIHTANVGTQVLAANGDRQDFEISVSSCAAPAAATTKIFYSFTSTGISSTTATTDYPWINHDGTGGRLKVTNPQHINYEGPVYMVAEGAGTGCKVRVIEWESSSQLFR